MTDWQDMGWEAHAETGRGEGGQHLPRGRGQDHESYSDDQDHESYTVPEEPLRLCENCGSPDVRTVIEPVGRPGTVLTTERCIDCGWQSQATEEAP